MAPMQDKQRYIGGEKASGFSEDARHLKGVAASTLGKKNPRSDRKNEKNEMRDGKKGGAWRRLTVDLLLLLVLAALIVGGIWGYRTLKSVYAPEWTETKVEFCIRIRGVDVAGIYDEEGRSLFEDCDVWYSDLAEGELLGTVVDVEAPPEEDGNTATLYLTVRGKALYRTGEGYYVGDTRLLAGMEDMFRVRGMMAKGEVISLCEIH